MEGETATERFRNNAAGIASTVVTGVWLAALVLDFDWWLGALLFGYIVVIPVVSMLFGDEEESGIEESGDDSWTYETEKEEAKEADEETPLETLRQRYAAGELSEEQFEHKLEQLLETETIEDVEERAEAATGAGGRKRARARTVVEAARVHAVTVFAYRAAPSHLLRPEYPLADHRRLVAFPPAG